MPPWARGSLLGVRQSQADQTETMFETGQSHPWKSFHTGQRAAYGAASLQDLALRPAARTRVEVRGE